MKAGRIENYLMAVWYGGRSGHWLRPLGALYGGMMRVRAWLFERGVLRSWRAPVPVIVVGNLTVGGTGKTPLVLHLVAALQAAGQRPGIVSRGYGGSAGTATVLLVDADSDAAVVGDEPVLLARRSGCPVAVSARRSRAVNAVVAAGAQVVVSDDGLQHLALARDAQIVVIDGQRRLGNRRCLPAGPLRAPLSVPVNADITVVNGGTPADPVVMTLVANEAVRIADGSRAPLARFAGQEVHAVAAIGQPERFFSTLRDAGMIVIGHPHRDHSLLDRSSLEFGDDRPVFITEKDAVKCVDTVPDDCWYVPVDAQLDAAGQAAVGNLIARVMDSSLPS